MTTDSRLSSPEFAAGMDARRQLRKVATDLARASHEDAQTMLTVLVVTDARTKGLDGDELVKNVGKTLADHRADVRVERLARMAEVNHLDGGTPA